MQTITHTRPIGIMGHTMRQISIWWQARPLIDSQQALERMREESRVRLLTGMQQQARNKAEFLKSPHLDAQVKAERVELAKIEARLAEVKTELWAMGWRP